MRNPFRREPCVEPWPEVPSAEDLLSSDSADRERLAKWNGWVAHLYDDKAAWEYVLGYEHGYRGNGKMDWPDSRWRMGVMDALRDRELDETA